MDAVQLPDSLRGLASLRGRRALITGGLGNLGKIFSETLAELGADLILVDRECSQAYEFQNRLISKWSIKCTYIPCDLELESERINLINLVNSDDDDLSILINNAAFVGNADLPGWGTCFEEQNILTWRRAIEVNLTAAFHLSQGLIPLLRKGPGGSIINVASIYGDHGPDWRFYEETMMGNPAAYSVSKGGLMQLTRWLATTVAPVVRVNAISPGGIYRNQPNRFIRKYCERVPLNRMATENDFRGIVAFLASDLSAYITGQVLAVDGGFSVW